MLYELTKKEKKLAREIIEKGVHAEFTAGLKKSKDVIAQWEKGSINNRDAYHKLFTTITDQDKRIQKRYDGVTGSRYLRTVAAILYEKQVAEEDIEGFSDEAKKSIHAMVSSWKEDD